MLAPIELNVFEVAEDKEVKGRLNVLINRIVACYRYLRADVKTNTDKIEAGVSTGWFDDGTNFRITVTDGIITAIEDSSGAGHS